MFTTKNINSLVDYFFAITMDIYHELSEYP